MDPCGTPHLMSFVADLQYQVLHIGFSEITNFQTTCLLYHEYRNYLIFEEELCGLSRHKG